ncbi:uncharacterized protein LOC129739223 isoform X4 [Uranotaenia lowii]|uniref:uncharacterized protein LOC129739223 isoform X4 n=1 Tax=Uranotaenia lowii TaxID=190385 RepID=UPI0024792CDA|nr:uncharacterized protein LOC129739223 isoform X4 [Uranotaenia lowii]
MAALDSFPDLPQNGEISICERDGRICSLPINEVVANSTSTNKLSSDGSYNTTKKAGQEVENPEVAIETTATGSHHRTLTETVLGSDPS